MWWTRPSSATPTVIKMLSIDQSSMDQSYRSSCKSIDQSINSRSIKQVIDHLIDQWRVPSIDKSLDPSINDSLNQAIDQSIDHSLDPSTDGSINQSIGQSINPRSIKQVIDHLTDQSRDRRIDLGEWFFFVPQRRHTAAGGWRYDAWSVAESFHCHGLRRCDGEKSKPREETQCKLQREETQWWDKAEW